MEQDSQITPVEIKEITEAIEVNEDLQWLMKNKRFQRVILNMYLKDGAVMLTKNLAKLKYRDNVKMDIINDGFISRSTLYSFFEDIERNGLDAQQALNEINEGE